MQSKIVTPISNLSKHESFFKIVTNFGQLEGRDYFNDVRHLEHVTVFHSELELHQEWNYELENELRHELLKFPNLEAISFHMVTCFRNFFIKAGVAIGLGTPMSDKVMRANVLQNCVWLKNTFPELKIMVENNNDLGSDAYQIVTDPDFITEIVNENEIYLLYDHAHALISAYNQNVSFMSYFSRLPLNKVMQVHFSEPTFLNGVARDTHNFPTREQFDFCSTKFKDCAQYYTIEFYKSLPKLEQGLRILKKVLK